MKDIEFLDDPTNTFMIWVKNEETLQRFIKHLNDAKVFVHQPENFASTDISEGYFLESQNPIEREAAEAIIQSFNSN